MRTETGFSLIETLVVVGLVAIIGGAAVPVVAGGLSRYNLTTASQQVASTVRAARFQAVGRNEELDVRFNFPAAGQYQITDDGGTAIGTVQTLPDGVTFVGDPADVEIETSGRMPVSCPCAITLTNGDETQNRTIALSRAGRVQLQ